MSITNILSSKYLLLLLKCTTYVTFVSTHYPKGNGKMVWRYLPVVKSKHLDSYI